MSSVIKNLSLYDELNVPDASEMAFGIVVSDWNRHITTALFEACQKTLLKHGARAEKIHIAQVPGSFELPVGARILAQKENLDAVICLGCVIKGETEHDRFINQAVATGLVNLGISTGKPFIFGLLTVNDEQQALDRAGGKHGNKGDEAAITAIRMAALKTGEKGQKRKIGF